MRVVAAFAAVYLIWGSTYLAIRFAIETVPPFTMAGVRYLIAGAVLYGWMRLRGTSSPTRYHWISAAIVGGLLLLGGNGGVVWAEQRVPSGLTALLITSVPLWMALLNWLRPGGMRPSGPVAIGLFTGFAGVALLVSPGELAGGLHVDPLGGAVLLLASLSWAAGSLYSRHARFPESALLATAMEMIAGGVLLLAAGLVAGEWARLDLAAVSPKSFLAFAYLIAFGSLVGFTAYIWLLRVTTPARVSTYAYVNPVVAVFLGWALAGEPLTPRTLIAAAIIICAVVLITTYGARRSVQSKGSAAAITDGSSGDLVTSDGLRPKDGSECAANIERE
jgi:drug/metabolite transporter (DMT)-like permease